MQTEEKRDLNVGAATPTDAADGIQPESLNGNGHHIAEIEMTPAGQVTALPTTVAATVKAQRFALFRELLGNSKARLGIMIVAGFILVAIFAPIIAPGDPSNFVDRPHQEPST